MTLDAEITRLVTAAVADALRDQPPRLAWTADEVAASLGVSRSTVHSWIRDQDMHRRLRAFRVGSILRVTDAELRRFLAERSGVAE